MSSQTAVTNNAVLVWEDMKALERASNAALEKGDVSTSLRNVLAILTLLNGVSMTRETESADRQTSNVQLLRQIQKWIKEENLTAAQVAERILEATGQDILGPFDSLSGALNNNALNRNGDHAVLNHISLAELRALVGRAKANGTGISIATLDPTLSASERQDYALLMQDTWFDFLKEQSLDRTDGDGGLPDMDELGEMLRRAVRVQVLDRLRTDTTARALAETYGTAQTANTFETYASYMKDTYGDQFFFPRAEELNTALREAPARLELWDEHLANKADSSIERLVLRELDRLSHLGTFQRLDVSGTTVAEAQQAVHTALAGEIADLFQAVGVGGDAFDPGDPTDAAAAAAFLADADPVAAGKVTANLDQILRDTIGIDFSGLEDGLASGGEQLADRIQSRIDVDTRLSDNQALSLNELLQQQRVLLTLISELVDKQTYLNRLVLTQ